MVDDDDDGGCGDAAVAVVVVGVKTQAVEDRWPREIVPTVTMREKHITDQRWIVVCFIALITTAAAAAAAVCRFDNTSSS